MTIRRPIHLTIAAAFGLAAALGFSGCLDEGLDPSFDDESSLEFGGYAMSSDDSSDDDFGEDSDPQALLDMLGDALDDDDDAVRPDELDTDRTRPEDLTERPDRIARTVMVVWGKPVFDRDFDGPRVEWRGHLWSDVATLVPLRKIAFEPGDQLIRDGNPNTVAFKTFTGPHHDGVLIRIVAPRTQETLDGVLSFRTTKFQTTIPLADLLGDYDETFRVDEDGNALHIATVRPGDEDGAFCPHGLLRLRWERLSARGGIFGGLIYGAMGQVQGVVAGVWGRVDGRRIFKGFILDRDHQYVGTLRGAWQPFADESGLSGGTFRGVWQRRDRPVDGVLRGIYRVRSVPSQGFAHGGWRANCDGAADRCDSDVIAPAPEPRCLCWADEENDGERICRCAVPTTDVCGELGPRPDHLEERPEERPDERPDESAYAAPTEERP